MASKSSMPFTSITLPFTPPSVVATEPPNAQIGTLVVNPGLVSI